MRPTRARAFPDDPGMAARNKTLRPPTSIPHRPKRMNCAPAIPTSTHAPTRFRRGKRHLYAAKRVTRSRSPGGMPRCPSDETTGPRPAPGPRSRPQRDGYKRNHPLWLMQLAGAACHSPPGVDELLGFRLAGSARQIVIDRNGASLCLKACRLARLARRSPSIVSTRRPSMLGVTAGSRSLRRCCCGGSAGRVVGVLGGQVGYGIVAFSRRTILGW